PGLLLRTAVDDGAPADHRDRADAGPPHAETARRGGGRALDRPSHRAGGPRVGLSGRLPCVLRPGAVLGVSAALGRGSDRGGPRAAAHVKRLTPPGPTSSPTMMNRKPIITRPRKITYTP